MPSASYSFIDVAALDGVRERFATGDALAILSNDLNEVIWANGPGADLLGYDDIEAAIGTASRLGTAAKRQIASTRGFPEIGKDRPVQVRMTTGMSSRMISFLASSLVLPDGEMAIMLACPAATGGARSQRDIAERAVGGFAEVGHFVAFLDAAGLIEAATPGFDALGLTQETLAGMVRKAGGEAGRIVKQMIPGRNGALPAGLARLTDWRNLLVVVDEGAADEEEAAPTDAMTAEEAEPTAETTADEAPAAEAASEPTPIAAEAEEPAPAQEEKPAAETESPAHEIWYFSEDGSDEQAPAAAGSETVTEASEVLDAAGADAEVEPAPVADEPDAAPESTDGAKPARGSPAGPVRFVWRTDAEGKFSQVSPEFLDAVGLDAGDLVGMRFEDVAQAFGIDPKNEIAGLLARRDTWSGRSVMWPIAGTDLHIPVDLAALPVYDRNRMFEGFRGFGVARTGDASVDPKGLGLILGRTVDETRPDSAPVESESEDDPFRGEAKALSIVPAQERRFTDKVIRLAEHRQAPANDKGLSTGERIAFQQIGERLKKDSDTAFTDAETPQAKAPPIAPKTPASEIDEAERNDNVAAETELTAGDADAEPIADNSHEIDELQRIDGVSEEPQGDTAEEAPTESIATEAEAPAEEPATPESRDVDASEAEQAKPAGEAEKAARPGMSLLNFAQWDNATEAASPETSVPGDAATEAPSGEGEIDNPVVEPAAPNAQDREAAGWRKFTLVEMEDAVGLDVWSPESATPTSGDAAPDVAAYVEDEPSSEDPLQPAPAAPDKASPLKTATGLSILEKLPVPVLVHSGDTLHYANDEFAELTGYRTVDELAEAGGIGVLFADSYEDEEAPEKVDRQLRLKTREGEEFPVEAFLQSVPWNGGKALLLVLSRAKEGAPAPGQSPLIAELEARVAEMRTIIDTATDGVVLISQDGTIRSISRPAEALFAFESDEVAGKPFVSLFAIESQRAARDYLAGLSENGVASVLNDGREVIGREAEGRFIPLFMTIGKLPNDSGYCAVVRDITQWKRAEEELTQARAVAERASSQKTDFLARVSHEIRTPLNAIIGFSELMVDEKFGPVANDRYRDYLRDINRSGSHVLDLVNDLLDISKIEAGQQEMDYVAVSLNDTLAETVAMMQPQANRERVIIRSSFASKLPDVVADQRSVRQIALNLLSNAVRYTQAGGQVIVSTAYEAAGDVVMRVRDTGIGMSSSEIDQALKPFKQINSMKRARGDGTGLGLPLTKAMVEANRAKFIINSTPGEGTLVEISFPSTRVLAE